MPEIEIIIRRDGTIEMDGQGFSGPACEAKMQQYLKALGKPKSETKKNDMYRVATQQVQQQKT